MTAIRIVRPATLAVAAVAVWALAASLLWRTKVPADLRLPSLDVRAVFGAHVVSAGTRFDRFFTMGNPPDYEPGPEKSVAAIATRTGQSPEEVAYDYMLEDGQYLYFPIVNYVTGDHEPIREMLNDPACLLGLSDGGAHCTSIVDAGVPSYMLSHWGRDRSRGPRLPPCWKVPMRPASAAVTCARSRSWVRTCPRSTSGSGPRRPLPAGASV